MTVEDVLWDIHKRILALPKEAKDDKMPTDYSVYNEEGKTVIDVVNDEYEMASNALFTVQFLKEEMQKRYGRNNVHEISIVMIVLDESISRLDTFVKMMDRRKRRINQDVEVMKSFNISEEAIQKMVSSGLINVNYEILKKTKEVLAGEEPNG